VFYRESLARILALEIFRNLIEMNIQAGISLYTDHKPALKIVVRGPTIERKLAALFEHLPL
jgi:hypothetical protein